MKNLKYLLATLLIAGSSQYALAEAPQESVKPSVMIMEIMSPYSFDETISRFNDNVKKYGWKTPKKYNWVGLLKKKTGKDIGGPMVMYEMCKPNHAYNILKDDEYKHLSVLMPCATSFYQKEDGNTYVAYMNVEMVASMYGGEIGKIAIEAGRDRDQVLAFLRK